MKIKKGDKVKIILGKDRGKTGKVLRIVPEKGKLSVEGLNLSVKHRRPQKEGEKGEKITFPALLDVSNVMLVCPKCEKATRIAYKILENGKKIRTCRRCQEAV